MKRKIGILTIYLVIIIATISIIVLVLDLLNIYKHKPSELSMYARTSKTGFQVLQDNEWEDFFVKGVNIGAALPGKWFTEFPEDEDVYSEWFDQIGSMNANCIRVYTLLPPQFYSALEDYNKKHTESPLWLLQEIWPEENPDGDDYLNKTYQEEYIKEIEYAVDAIHGEAIIPKRKGRAYGVYTKDVSRYVLGYLVGRELEPDEVITTNEKNNGFRYSGEYLSSGDNASPSEAWLSMNCDYVLKYEENSYNSQHPVAIVSWPTLDPIEHDSEWNTNGLKSLEYNDKVSIDINHIETGKKMKSGFFGAYHIYPNYPDFMNNESKYNDYYDEDGRLCYGGYLQEFIAGHTKYPALVAEFGLATGMGNAHSSPDGLNHGGLTEEQQGDGIIRMMRAIHKEGYAGGVVFEWMDEWAKKTWTTEPFMIPYDRHAYWFNAIDPEQNYGLLAMEPETPKEDEYVTSGNSVIKSIGLKHDSAYLYMDIELTRALDFDNEKILIGLDTYDREKGEFKFMQSSDIEAPSGLEFLLDINGQQNSKFLVQPGYNISKNKYSSLISHDGIFEEIIRLIGNERITKDGQKINAVYNDESKLNFGELNDNSYNQLYFENNKIYVRLPWGRLNFTDPSIMSVLDDTSNISELTRDNLKTVTSEGIIASVLLYNTDCNEKIDLLSLDKPYSWKTWNEPLYSERFKKSYYAIQEYFGELK